MFTNIEDFVSEWQTESELTLKIFGALTDESLNQMVYPEGRTLGQIAWHIILSLDDLANRTGLSPEAPPEDETSPASGAVLAEKFRIASESLLEQVRKQWTDAMLSVDVEVYGSKWKRGFILESIIRHQTHHRGQLTVLMRQAGLKVPGVYGPSKEEWEAYGRPPEK